MNRLQRIISKQEIAEVIFSLRHYYSSNDIGLKVYADAKGMIYINGNYWPNKIVMLIDDPFFGDIGPMSSMEQILSKIKGPDNYYLEVVCFLDYKFEEHLYE